MSTRPILPDERPAIVRLERPLSIVTSEEMGVATPGAFLVSAGKRRRAAEVVVPAGEFDGDLAFRELDDVRTRAEEVFHWVEESLALGPTTAPRPAAEKPWRQVLAWLAFWVLVVGGGLALSQLPEFAVLTFAAPAFLILLLILGRFGWVKGGPLASMCISIALLCAMPLPFLYEVEGIVASFLVSFVAVAIAFLEGGTMLRDRRANDLSGPVEYVLREGEAARYRPELCLVGDVLCVVIRCESASGHLMRQVVVPVRGATREDAARAALWAQDYDIALRKEREDEAAAADALRRVQALERSRRTLPDP